MKKQYPLSGFDKISFEEFLGILEILNTFGRLGSSDKDAVLLIMDGLKFRREKGNEKTNKKTSGKDH